MIPAPPSLVALEPGDDAWHSLGFELMSVPPRAIMDALTH